MKYRSVQIVRTIALISLVLGLSACFSEENSRISKISRDLADQLSSGTGRVNSNSETASSQRRVYIDSSLSMKGFVSGSATGNRTTFEDFIDAMPDVLPGCEVYQYGQMTTTNINELSKPLIKITQKAEFDSRLHNPNSYTLSFNPDDVLIGNLLEEKEPVLSVLLTDGVESDQNGQVNTVVVEAFRKWLDKGNTLGILVLKSRFYGQFYSERLRRMLKENVAVDARPFYAFIFSPSKREFEDLREKLARRFPAMQTFMFSDDAVTSRTEMPISLDASYDNAQPPDKPYYWQMFTGRNPQAEQDGTFVFKFIYNIKPTYPAKSLGLRINPKIHRWDSSQNQFQPEGTSIGTEIAPIAEEAQSGQASQPGKNQSFTLNIGELLKRDNQDNYSFYAIEQTPYIKEAADEISTLSTRDDSTPSSADKTYRFQELIFALLEVHVKSRLVPSISPHTYITVVK